MNLHTQQRRDVMSRYVKISSHAINKDDNQI